MAKSMFNNALEFIKDSKIAIENERFKMSINRSYYAVFYGAKALLIKKGINPKTHRGTIQQFGLEYVINDSFDNEISKILSNLEDDREDADYEFQSIFTYENAMDNLNKAEIFLDECSRFL
ncbi:MAG: HEPN domain-containing protein [Methanobrevibacter sp.]|nr:HEPN domain-containing protein [Methanobrevibacter sp.]